MKKKRYAGSYTVEATFVMTIVIFIIFAIIYLSFYLVDKSKVQGIADLTVVKVSEMLKVDGTLETGEVDYTNINNKGWISALMGDYSKEEQMIKNHIHRKLRDSLLISKVDSVSVEINKSKIKISLKAAVNIPLLQVRRYYTKESLTLNIRSSAAVHNPAEFIRLSECILTSASEIKGADKVIGNLKNMITKLFGTE